jgi:flagellar hook-basal body complex protein FliE
MADLRITPPVSVASLGAAAASPAAASPAASGESFLASLQDALGRLNETQAQADESVQALLTGRTTNIHETMIALQKADVSFQVMLQVRNKVVSAYEEIMRMQL